MQIFVSFRLRYFILYTFLIFNLFLLLKEATFLSRDHKVSQEIIQRVVMFFDIWCMMKCG